MSQTLTQTRHPNTVPADFRGEVPALSLAMPSLLMETSLPAALQLAALEEFAMAAEASEDIEPPTSEVFVARRQRPLILAVDDEVINLDLIESAFEEEEFDFVFASNGAEAVALAARHMPDLILLDVMMPRMDGFDACTKLKENPLTARIPVMFITGLGDAMFETLGLELGAVDFISKPINPPSVRARVKNHIQLTLALEQLTAAAELESSLRREVLEALAFTNRGQQVN